MFGVVLTGAGKLFCSGMELRSDKAATLRPESAFARLAAFAKPLIARVNGPCLGGGVGILFCCDVRFVCFLVVSLSSRFQDSPFLPATFSSPKC